MKLKESTIKDFAKAFGDSVEISEVIPKVSVKNNLKEIFLPILDLKEAVLEAYEIFVNVFKCVLYFTLFPIVVIKHCFYARNRIRLLYLYLIKHRKEIKAYKNTYKSKRRQNETTRL